MQLSDSLIRGSNARVLIELLGPCGSREPCKHGARKATKHLRVDDTFHHFLSRMTGFREEASPVGKASCSLRLKTADVAVTSSARRLRA
eukprot:4668125-Pleurochrysis_carterae.AAC.1